MKFHGIGGALALAFAPAAWAQLTINTTSVPNGTQGTFYSAQVGSDGSASATWRVSAGALPTGISLTVASGPTATISGTPTTPGPYSFTLTITDPEFDDEMTSKAFSITIASIPVFTTTSPLPSAMVGMNYNLQFAASGGSPPYTFSSPNLPAGLQMNTSGAVSGVPTTANSYLVSVTVFDSLKASTTSNFVLLVTPALVFNTTSPLPAGVAGAPYSQAIVVSGGTQPYSFSITTVPAPAGLSISASGALSGESASIATYTFTVQVTDYYRFAASKQYTLSFAAAPPLLQVSPASLTFSASIGGNTPYAQALSIVSPSAVSTAFQVTVDTGAPGTVAPAWISVTPAAGASPARLIVSVNASTLSAGPEQAVIHVTVPRSTTQASIDIPVMLNVAAAGPQLQATPGSLQFGAHILSPGIQQQTLLVANAGGGGVQNFTASVVQNSPWIVSVTPLKGQAGPDSPAFLQVKVNSLGLAVGFYHDIVQLTSSSGNVDVPVTLMVVNQGSVLAVGLTGVRFLAIQGSGTARPQSISIINNGDQSTTVHWSADLLSGSDWLAISNPSGTSTVAQPGELTLSANSSVVNLPAGPRYALVRISDPNSQNSPQYIAAVLDLEPANTLPLADPSPAGLFFTSNTGAQKVLIYTSSSTSAAFQTSASTNDGAAWLTVTPSSAISSTSTPGQITVSVSATGLAPGIYTGNINIGMSGVLVIVNVTFVVLPPAVLAGVPAAVHPLASAACTPSKLALTETGLVNNFSVPAGWPATLIAQLNDDCGNPITGGAVVASFNNGDPPLSLTGDQTTNVYSASWQPGTALPEMTISLTASAGTFPSATQQFIGSVNANAASPPSLLSNGTLHIFFDVPTADALGTGLAPGNVAQVYGSGFGPTLGATTVPLPTELSGTFLLVGAYQVPLFFVINSTYVLMAVQIPFELAPNQQYPEIASVNGALSNIITVTVVPMQPGIAVGGGGFAGAQHLDYTSVNTSNPAKPGEQIVVYLAGLGATNPSVPTGAATPPQLVPAAVEPVVMLDGQNITPVYAGLTPTGIGLYQINFVVPTNARSGNLNLTVTQGGVLSNTAIIPVSN